MNASESPSIEWLGRIDFDAALERQESEVRAVRAGESPGRLFLLEHEPVFTIGRTRDRSSLLGAQFPGIPLREINRGGQATWHGPGQLVGYAILDLHHHGRDLAKYLRFLEDLVIGVLAECGVAGTRREGLTGVWVDDRKIASIGVGVRHWITMHGFALNICGELDGFARIIPCGISDVRMTSIEREAGRPATVREVADLVAQRFPASLESLGS